MTQEAEHDPLKDIWQDDKLNRRRDAEVIRQFTLGHLDLRERAGQTRTYVLNLDADWGAGKTFFLQKLKAHLEHHKHVAIYINAWEEDYSEDPFLTVVNAIQIELKTSLQEVGMDTTKATEIVRPLVQSTTKVLGNALLSGGKHFLARYVGEAAVDQFGSLLKKEEDWEEGSELDEAINSAITSAIDTTGAELLSNFRIQQAAQQNFKVELTEVGRKILDSGKFGAPIFVLIDELDRCRPSYAIELLERVKHLFSIENFIYILGTDTKQLSHAVCGVYGQEFDGKRYLKRFIDRTYNFQNAKTEDFISYSLTRRGLSEEMFTAPKPYTVLSYISFILDKTRCSLRDIEQIIDIMATFKALWPYEDAEIDIITLLHLSYLQHQAKETTEINEEPLKSISLTFPTFADAKTRDISYKMIVAMAGARDSAKFPQPRDEFEHWLLNKQGREQAAYQRIHGSIKNKPSPVVEYRNLISQVATIQEK